jgi:hypothetical protein
MSRPLVWRHFGSDLSNPTQALEWKEILAAAQGLGLKLQSLGVRGACDFDGAFEAALKERAQAKQIAVTVPPSVLARADSVIK